MAPNSKIILIRHGEATHNLNDDFQQHDPPLTPLGKEQCVKLLKEAFAAGEWDDFKDLDLVIISPLFRTLETGFHVFGDQIEQGLKYVILPEIQETSPNPCDTGRSTEVLQSLFPGVDFKECDRTNWLVKSHGFYTRDNLPIRAAFVRKWLYERPEKVIAVVTHSGFLRWLTPQDFPFVEPRDKYRNCEYRTYEFAGIQNDDGDGGPYKLVEEQWSRELRKAKRLDHETLQTPSGETVRSTDTGVPREMHGLDGACDDDPDQPTIVF
ncbi:hypothetical protein H072_9305 [Dactylellina haptotyla CBS 200.50]|uniref:Phosphoglycerate mutase-like protein n=1 Tax=Dactylellina haptotyla (strain CBS 200.50) TaxID=1284197 RepID=S8A263_DACHA|nr:hypothetical protein H072_9305 [Dactylellina haptotyla CBS 200.50]